MFKNKKEALESVKISIHVIAFIFFAMGAVSLILGILYLPNIVPYFFPEDKLGRTNSVLYPTYVCLQIVQIGSLLVSLLLGIVNFIWWRKTTKLESSFKWDFAVVAIVTFIVPNILIFPMVSSNDVQTPLNEISADIDNYRLGNVDVYYGPLKLLDKEIMEGPFESKAMSINYLMQKWEIKDDVSNRGLEITSWVRSSFGISNSINTEEGKEYKITYLPKTFLICDVQPFDRWSADNTPIENNVFSNPTDGRENEKLMNYLNSKDGLEHKSKELANAIKVDPNCEIIYANVNLDDDDKNPDYIVFVKSVQKNVYGMLAVRNSGGNFRLSLLPGYMDNKTATVSILTSTSYHMHDIRMDSKDGSESMLFEYNGLDNYKDMKKK